MEEREENDITISKKIIIYKENKNSFLSGFLFLVF